MTSNTFTAKYHGQCAAQCGRMIEPDDEVVYLVNDDLAHVDCTQEVDPISHDRGPKTSNGRWNTATCPHCFMVLPLNGACDCRD